jgi:hypothetical protein
MGREIYRVPLTFSFPLDQSAADTAHFAHLLKCVKEDHDDCDTDWTPPAGEGWQLWQTVSDGPISPVFKTADELIDWMSQPETDPKVLRYGTPSMPWGQGWPRETAEKFVKGPRWAPSGVITLHPDGSSEMISGVDFMIRGKS